MITFQDGWREEDIHSEISKTQSLAQYREVFQMLQPSIEIDGNQWCVIWGTMPEKYIAGFGDTLSQAVSNFYNDYLNQKVSAKAALNKK